MQTTLKELPDSRVEVQAEVAAEDVQKAANRTARAMAREMRMPGFRKGKAPPNLVIQRLGFAAVLSEAIRDALPEWYERALLDAGVTPIGDPDIDIVSAPEAEGEPLTFKFEVACGRRRSSATTRSSRSARRTKRSTRRSSTPRSTGSARVSPGSSRWSARPPRATRC